MTRIQPEFFIECYTDAPLNAPRQEKINAIEFLEDEVAYTEDCPGVYTTAIFLIKPTTIPLAERLEARKRDEAFYGWSKAS